MSRRIVEAEAKPVPHIVMFTNAHEVTVPVRIEAVPGKEDSYYYLKALQQMGGDKGVRAMGLREKEIIVVKGAVDLEPPRANEDGYR